MTTQPPTEPLWVTALMAMDSTPGRPCNAMAAALRVIAAEVDRRGSKGLDFDPVETADWLNAEADAADADAHDPDP